MAPSFYSDRKTVNSEVRRQKMDEAVWLEGGRVRNAKHDEEFRPRSHSSRQSRTKRVADDGIPPQITVDQNGTVHLVYFKGDPSQRDLFYARSNDSEKFSDPIRVVVP